MKQQYDVLLAKVKDLEQDAVKAEQGNVSAGTRLRKGLQEVKRLAQDLRVLSLEAKKSKKD